ncbi:cytochrome C oxidase copper chaperone-domain-containing protein [Talaromyces proteolyticus]|uniref:Cytochrome C oxidase copper chaperone-domain-containing protein n=1 Tax=Talaromyces proteolyticus TaxID=1131652 RepID=A0AAD4KYZ2_9EURO|nr:cytochrome C oxidase copper chaperone-domain-containing protein [Talaromyces proteolyticus]KAH8703582.1 cytochrome C oxidase copper chaperone-domain-containing protein [Talaromyces proteolyticus]
MWFFGSSNNSIAAPAPEVTSVQKSAEPASKPKPCCVCTKEKSTRDDCMLFSKSDDPAQTECKSLVEEYKSCMAGYGFKV